MSRLTDKNVIAVCGSCSSFGICKTDESCFIKEVYAKLKRLEDLEETGRLIELPCKVGDTVWVIHYGKVFEAKITRVVLGICNSSTYINLDVSYEFVDPFYNDGRMEPMTAICRYLDDVFLTKAEAEAKLAELKGCAE